ncbi:hypothetical protein B0H17DRAFT_1138961 [Mycena rosella]|uniref:Uncharacterized protein n=1 Tax=Mycena rosella TaxID=1033263 RepID=A0AAD7G939_MYCRO|nr:hypothetical protein B0H17DRAFT_1138961 [Mycena rosella]
MPAHSSLPKGPTTVWYSDFPLFPDPLHAACSRFCLGVTDRVGVLAPGGMMSEYGALPPSAGALPPQLPECIPVFAVFLSFLVTPDHRLPFDGSAFRPAFPIVPSHHNFASFLSTPAFRPAFPIPDPYARPVVSSHHFPYVPNGLLCLTDIRARTGDSGGRGK